MDTPHERDAIKRRVKKAKLTDDGWEVGIIDDIKDDFARGYITAHLANLPGEIGQGEEEYRDEFLRVLYWDIWGR